MNERITELAVEADQLSPDDDEWCETFARLIVQECIDYASRNGDNVAYLKQHFGVDKD